MIIFRYDKTFEGLLTAVFDSFARREKFDALLSEGEPAPLFTTVDHTVVTDREKAARVWRGLQKRLSKEVTGMLSMGWLSEEQGVDMSLARFMRRVFGEDGGARDGSARCSGTRDGGGARSGGGETRDDCKTQDGGGTRGDGARDERTRGGTRGGFGKLGVATDFSDPDILRVKQLATKVSKERERMLQFTRFQKGADGSFFAPVSPIYNVLPMVIDWFADRFRDQRWLIYDIERRYGFYFDTKTVVEVTMENDAHLLSGILADEMLAADEKLFQSGWRDYIDGMAIRERINPRLQRQHMPRRFWPLLPEKR